MGRESRTVRTFVVKALAPLHARPVENSVWAGYPDVEFIGGVMEIKRLSGWPAREDTPVQVPHFSDDQRFFLEERSALGEPTWFLLVVAREWLLFDGTVAATAIGLATQAQLRTTAAKIWKRRPKPEELLEAVT